MKKQQKTVEKIISLYPSLPIIDKIFCRLRFLIFPVKEILRIIPNDGSLLDIGCGYGFITNAIAILNPHLSVYGFDINKYRIKLAQNSVSNRNNIRFLVSDLNNKLDKLPKYNVITCIDLLHHIEKKFHNRVIADIYDHLEKNGTLIIKDIDTRPWYKYYWNYFHDLIVNKGQLVYCRSHFEWISMLKKKGFQIKLLIFPKKGLLYPHFIITAIKL
ncbi:MAG: class I SAM-dependent methyltransferase [Candidatus Roizmanbacteria bacterium]|nr:class I SAM-dependent methyltransferase [Candidatus Roizmanbacteria bacterium]MCR4312700.1 class I SAM-dependent methyltransferase [Candidatus Roizmanbacteria bacterium]